MYKNQFEQARLAQVNDCITVAKSKSAVHRYQEAIVAIEAAEAVVVASNQTEYQSLLSSLQIARAEYLRLGGKFQAAECLLQKVIVETEQFPESESLKKAAARNALGVVSKYLGKLDNAKRLYCEAFRICRNQMADSRPLIVTILYNMAGVLHSMSRFEQGIRFAERALEMLEAGEFEETESRAILLSCLAANFEGMSDFDRAIPAYRHSIKLLRSRLGNEHRDIAINLNNLGNIHLVQGDYHAAEEYFRRALKMKLKLLGSSHPDSATTLFNLAKLLQQRGQWAQARVHYSRARRIFLATFGPNHPKTIAATRRLNTKHSVVS